MFFTSAGKSSRWFATAAIVRARLVMCLPVVPCSPVPTLASMQLPAPKSWDEFEEITLSALKLRWRTTYLFRNGRQGQPQAGVDIWGTDELGRPVGVQCKLSTDALTEKEIAAEIAKAETFRPPIEAYYVATTAPRDVRLAELVRSISKARRAAETEGSLPRFPIGILFWDDISQDLLGDVSEFKKHYPQFHVAGLDTPKIEVAIGDGEEGLAAGPSVSVVSRRWSPPLDLLGLAALASRMRGERPEHDGARRLIALLQPIAIQIKNTGSAVLLDPRIEASVGRSEGLHVLEAKPPEPSPFVIPVTPVHTSFTWVNVREWPERFDVRARMAKIPPGGTGWTETFWIGAPTARSVEIEGRVLADNLPAPVAFKVTVEITVRDADPDLGLPDDGVEIGDP